MRPWLVFGVLAFEGLAVAAEGSDGRLHDPVRPTAQRVEVTIDPTQTQFSGTTTLTVSISEKIDGLSLHANEIEITEARIGKLGKKTKPVGVSAAERGIVRLDADRTLKPGLWEIEIAYTGALRDQTYGLYRFEVDGLAYVASQFQANDARTAWPCFDEPGFKVPLELVVTAPEGMAVIGNGPVASTAPGPALPDGRPTTVTHLAPTDPIPTYAAALMVGPYSRAEVTGMPVPGAVYTVAGHEAYGRTVVSEMPPILDALQTWFGSPQPYPKIDFVIVPRFSFGAMENPGAIVAAEQYLPPPEHMTPAQAEFAEQMIAHELAHFWFGDWVTMAWWDDLWLNESFAEWLSQQITVARRPAFRGEIGRVRRGVEMLYNDGGASAEPIRTEVDPTAVFETSNFSVYAKGEALLDMIEAYIGTAAFQEGLRTYLTTHAPGNATADDLFRALSDASNLDVQPVMDPYLDLPGAPWLMVDIVGQDLQITQQPFALRGATPPSKGPWTVPLRLRVGRPDGSSEVLTALLTPDEALQIPLGDATWVMPAADGIGHYVWSMADAHLDALIDARDQLTATERVQVLAMLGLRHAAGDLELNDVLRHAARFADDDDPEVLRSVVGRMLAVRFADQVGDPELSAAADGFLVETLRPLLDAVGREAVEDEPLGRRELRMTLLEILARANDAEIVAYGESIGGRVSDGDLPPEWIRFGLSTLARRSTTPEETQQLLWQWAEATEDPSLRRRYLAAFGQVQGEDALTRALTRAYDPQTPANDLTAIVLGGVFARNLESERDQILELSMAHHQDLVAKIPPVWQPRLAEFGSGCSTDRYETAKAFYGDPDRAVAGIDTVLAQVGADVAACQARLAADEPSLRQLLLGDD